MKAYASNGFECVLLYILKVYFCGDTSVEEWTDRPINRRLTDRATTTGLENPKARVRSFLHVLKAQSFLDH